MSAAACAKRIINQQTVSLLASIRGIAPLEADAAIATAEQVDQEAEGASEELLTAWYREDERLVNYLLMNVAWNRDELRKILINYIDTMRSLPLKINTSIEEGGGKTA